MYPLNINRPFEGISHIQISHLCLTLVSCFAYSSTLKMKAILPTETSIHFQPSTRRYIPEDRTLLNHRCEKLRAYTLRAVLSADVKLPECKDNHSHQSVAKVEISEDMIPLPEYIYMADNFTLRKCSS
jgi:hypothetical protein